MFVFTLFSDIHGIHCMGSFEKRIWIGFVGNFVLRMSDFGGRWSVILKNRGRSQKLRAGQGQKARAVVWQWVPTFKEVVPPMVGDN